MKKDKKKNAELLKEINESIGVLGTNKGILFEDGTGEDENSILVTGLTIKGRLLLFLLGLGLGEKIENIILSIFMKNDRVY
jgi:hypothetical protein